MSTESLQHKDGEQVCECCAKALESLFLHIQQNNKWGAFLVLIFFLALVVVATTGVIRA